MTGSEFQEWMKKMKRHRRYKTRDELTKLLGVSKNTITKYRREGCGPKVDLACQALIMGITKYHGPTL